MPKTLPAATMFTRILSICILTVAVTAGADAATWLVCQDGTGDFLTIQEAIDAATTGDVVDVCPGTYTGEGNRDLDLGGRNIVVRSRDDDPTTCIIDCQGTPAEPHRGFWIHQGEDATAVVQGFTITGGYAVDHGAGILVGTLGGKADSQRSLEKPRVVNCILSGNEAPTGAGFAVVGRDNEPVLSFCVIENNIGPGASLASEHVFGNLTLEDCVVRGNTGPGVYSVSSLSRPKQDVWAFVSIERTEISGNGGSGVYHTAYDTQLWLVDCEIVDNGGWGIEATRWFDTGEFSLSNSTVSRNSAGGTSVGANTANIADCVFDENLGLGLFVHANFATTITRVTLTRNDGIGVHVHRGSSVGLTSLTVADNTGTGVVVEEPYDVGLDITLANCLIDNNTGLGFDNLTATAVTATCTDIYNNDGGDWDGLPGQFGNDGNISADPMFCAPESGDYQIRSISPCASGGHPDGADCGLIGARDVGCTPAPAITAVADVPADQGGQIRLTWARSSSDDSGADPGIASYAIYRRQDRKQRPEASAPPAVRRLLGWDYLDSVPVRGDEFYQYVAPTLCDSTASGICWSTYFVSAVTDDPYVFYDSAADSGYSVDNFVPPAPVSFKVAYGVQNYLAWTESEAPDLAWYNIYRDDTADFDPGPENRVQQTTATVWMDAGGDWRDYYRLVAVDYAGNMSDPVGPDQVTSAGDTVPDRTELVGNYPNPFNPATTIVYNLAQGARVSLRIYDLRGRLVTGLVTGEDLAPGSYEVLWQGRDLSGQSVASGTYVYRLEAGSHAESRRLTLVK